MSRTKLVTGGIVGLFLAATAQGSPLTFIDDYEGFVEAVSGRGPLDRLRDPARRQPELGSGCRSRRVFNYTHLGRNVPPASRSGLIHLR